MIRILSVLQGGGAYLFHLEGKQAPFRHAFPPEFFPSVEEAVARTGQAGQGLPLITVLQCPTDLRFWGAPVQPVNDDEILAQFHEADRLLVATIPAPDLARLPDGPVLAEDSILIKAFTGRYRDEMKGVWYHLDLSSSKIVLFVYKGGQLLGMFPNLAGQDENAYLRELQGVFLDARDNFSNEPPVKIVVSGESPFERFRGTPISWMTPVMIGNAEAVLFDGEFRTFDETPHLNILLYGATQAFLDWHGADFRREFGISKGQKRPGPKQALVDFSGFIPLVRKATPSGIRNVAAVGLVLGLLFSFFGIAFMEYGIYSKKTELARREIRETNRQEINKGLEEYDKKVRLALKTLQDRIKNINELRSQQDVAYLICEEILNRRRPEEVQISKVTIQGRSVRIEGYVSFDTVLKPPVNSSPKERRAMVSESLSGVSLEDYYALFLSNLENSNGAFVDVQPQYEAKTNRADFIIEATYVKNGPDGKPLIAKSLEGQPVPLVLQIKEGR